ncbi:MAG: phytanoyl-CoA dioxygenase family protein [Myxococcota bacterium]
MLNVTQPSPEMLTSPPAAEVTAADRREARALPLSTRFTLGDRITPIQQAFLDEHGYLVFGQVASQEEVDRVLGEVDLIQERWLAERRKEINGIPVFIGKDPDGAPFIQRFAFTSLQSQYLYDFVRDDRFAPIRSLVGAETRVGDHEKDGLVFNRNLNVPGSAYPRLGWHTDGLRDLFLNREVPGPMLNVGMHFDRIRKEDGGLRIIPGSHRQGFWDMLTRKPYFVSHGVDADEIAVETEPGDLTVHDGRTWHRVEVSPYTGWRSLRRTMYVPYVTDAWAPKGEDSRTPFYHRLAQVARELRVRLNR